MDRNKLLYFIKDRGYRIDDFCKAIKMGKASFYKYCANDTFKVKHIRTIAKVLNLTQEDVDSIFFVDLVS